LDWATDNHLLYLDGLYMNYTLRPYQQEASDIAVRLLKNSDKPFVIQAATGAGKSLIIADICHRAGCACANFATIKRNTGAKLQ
jgi:superfamily II DNA or RNA helicase